MSTYRTHDDPPKCPYCSSERLIPNVVIEDATEHAPRGLQARVGYGDPSAWLLKEPILVPLRARICCGCGAVDLHASGDLGALWQRYEDLPKQV